MWERFGTFNQLPEHFLYGFWDTLGAEGFGVQKAPFCCGLYEQFARVFVFDLHNPGGNGSLVARNISIHQDGVSQNRRLEVGNMVVAHHPDQFFLDGFSRNLLPMFFGNVLDPLYIPDIVHVVEVVQVVLCHIKYLGEGLHQSFLKMFTSNSLSQFFPVTKKVFRSGCHATPFSTELVSSHSAPLLTLLFSPPKLTTPSMAPEVASMIIMLSF